MRLRDLSPRWLTLLPIGLVDQPMAIALPRFMRKRVSHAQPKSGWSRGLIQKPRNRQGGRCATNAEVVYVKQAPGCGNLISRVNESAMNPLQ